MDGEKLIEIICDKLRMDGELSRDSDIVRGLRQIKPQDFYEIFEKTSKDKMVKNG